MLEHQAAQLREFRTAEAMRGGQAHVGKLELCVALRLLDVDVRRLAALVAEEEEAVARDTENRRHAWKLLPRQSASHGGSLRPNA